LRPTGFRLYQESEVRITPISLDQLAGDKDKVLSRSFPLLDGEEENGKKPVGLKQGAPGSLDALLGGVGSEGA